MYNVKRHVKIFAVFMVITIDGPSGAGKTTIAKLAAKKKKFKYIDTGSIYRFFTLWALKRKTNLDDTQQVLRLVRKIKLSNLPIGKEIRKNYVTKSVYKLADKKEIREEVNKHVRKLARIYKNIVTEGRDQGSVVFPNANYKFYLDAEPIERAKRRQKEQKTIPLKKVLNDLKLRDKRDMTRGIAPLRRTRDMIYIDSTDLSIDQVVSKILFYIK